MKLSQRRPDEAVPGFGIRRSLKGGRGKDDVTVKPYRLPSSFLNKHAGDVE